VLTAHISTK